MARRVRSARFTCVFPSNPDMELAKVSKIWWLILAIGLLSVLLLATDGKKFGGFANGFQQAQPFTVVAPSSTAGMPPNSATTSRFIGSVSPQQNNLYDLGEPALSWRNVYTSGTLASSNLSFTHATGSTLDLTAGGPALKISGTNSEIRIGNWRFLDDGGSQLRIGGSAYSGAYITDASLLTASPRLGGVTNGLTSLGTAPISMSDGFFSGSVSSSHFYANAASSSATNVAFGSGQDHNSGLWFSGLSPVMEAGGAAVQSWSTVANTFYLNAAPNVNGAASLGISGIAWNDVFFIGNASGSRFLATTSTSAANPAFSFANTPNQGMWSSGANSVNISANGINVLQIEQNRLTVVGDIYSSSGATDIGSFLSHFRNIYASGTVITTNVSSTKMSVTALPEITSANANVCVDVNGNFTKDSSVACLTSNPKFKDNIVPLKMDGLKVVSALEPVEFDWKPGMARTGHDIGFNAEQAAAVDDRLVAHGEDGSVTGFKYQEFASVIVKAIQQVVARLTGLEARLDAQEREINELKLLIQHK